MGGIRPRLVPGTTLSELARTWLLSEFVEQEIEQAREKFGAAIFPTSSSWQPQFSRREADDLRWYIEHASVDAYTHGVVKMCNLILNIGLRNGTLVPNRSIRTLSSKYPTCLRLNCSRKLGVSAMRNVMRRVKSGVEQHGMYHVVCDNAHHLGYGALWVRQMTQEGFICWVQCTASKSEVIPYRGAKPTQGTNPITVGYPTAAALGFDIVVDAATSPISSGKRTILIRQGRKLPRFSVVDAKGKWTTDPGKAIHHKHSDALLSGLSTHIELIAALGGGGNPLKRARADENTPGGASNWMIWAAKPDYFSVAPGNPMQRVIDVAGLIMDDNGKARHPGKTSAENTAVYSENGDCLVLPHTELLALEKIAKQAGVDFDWRSFAIAS